MREEATIRGTINTEKAQEEIRRIKSLEDVNIALGKMHLFLYQDKAMLEQLNNAPMEARRKNLEKYFLNHTKEMAIREDDIKGLGLIEIFCYLTHRKGKIDFGFCQHYRLAVKGSLEVVLTRDNSSPIENQCVYYAKTVPTECKGNPQGCKMLGRID